MHARFFAVALALSSFGCGLTPSHRAVPVVLISVDTVRADHLPAYGYKGVKTPNLDALARDAILYENAYAHAPLTLPSHASLMTGLLPYENGVRDNAGFRLSPRHASLAKLLREKGYATGAAVSSYVLRSDRGLDAGFDFYDDQVGDNPTRERSATETARTLEEWASTAKEKPVFLFLHLFEPHAPYTPPEPFASQYANVPYDGEIAAADAAVGGFVTYLKRAGLYDRALIVFLSDHGEGLGDHGEEEHGVFLYREVIRVPLFLKLPGARDAGRRVASPVGLTDIFPTILSAAGLPVPPDRKGVSLLASRADPPRQIYSETLYPRLNLAWSDLASLTDDRYQYIEAPRPELYDLRADPEERRNLAPERPPAFRSLRIALHALNRAEALPEASTLEEIRKLGALGYVHVSSGAPTGALPDPKDRLEELHDFKLLFDCFYAGRDAEAIQVAERLLSRDSRILSAWQILSASLARSGRSPEAIEALERGVAASSGATGSAEEWAQAYDNLSLLLRDAGDLTGQERILKEALSRDLAREPMKRDLARIYAGSDRASEAVKLLKALPGAPEAETLEVLGVALAETGARDEARQTLLRAWSAAPGGASVAFNLGNLALREGDAAGAKEWFSRSLQANARAPATLAALGLAQAQLGDTQGAGNSWRKALTLDPRQYDSLYNLGLLELKAGRSEEARRLLERFAATAPRERYSRQIATARRALGGPG
jgi:arylsulfatase A-like enzyme/Flp pilus assembly protein TadD